MVAGAEGKPTSGRRGVSIGTLCAVVAVAAVDFAWWRYLLPRARPGSFHESMMGFRGPAFDAAMMPMVSVLVIGLVHVLVRRGEVSRGFVGFLVGGFVGLALYIAHSYACLAFPAIRVDTSWKPVHALMETLFGNEGQLRFFFVIMLCLVPPQFLPAAIGAIIAHRWKPKAAPAEISPPSEENP